MSNIFDYNILLSNIQKLPYSNYRVILSANGRPDKVSNNNRDSYLEIIDEIVNELRKIIKSVSKRKDYRSPLSIDYSNLDLKMDSDKVLQIIRSSLENENIISENKDQILSKEIFSNTSSIMKDYEENNKETFVSTLKQLSANLTKKEFTRRILSALKTIPENSEDRTETGKSIINDIINVLRYSLKHPSIESSYFSRSIQHSLSRAGADKFNNTKNDSQKESEIPLIKINSEEYNQIIQNHKDIPVIINNILELFKDLIIFTKEDFNLDCLKKSGDYHELMKFINSNKENSEFNTFSDFTRLYSGIEKSRVNKKIEGLIETLVKALNEKEKSNSKKEKINFDSIKINNSICKNAVILLKEKYLSTDISKEDGFFWLKFLHNVDKFISISSNVAKLIKILSNVKTPRIKNNTQDDKSPSIGVYSSYFDLVDKNGKFEIVQKNDELFMENIKRLTDIINSSVMNSAYVYLMNETEKVKNYISDDFEKMESEEEIEFLNGIGPTGEDEDFLDLSTVVKSSLVSKRIQSAGLGLVKLGKLVYFFVEHGGFVTFQKGLDYLTKSVNNALPDSEMQKVKRIRFYQKIYRDKNHLTLYKRILDILKKDSTNKPLIEKIIGESNKNLSEKEKIKKNTEAVRTIIAFRNLIETTVVKKVIISADSSFRKNRLEEFYNFMNTIVKIKDVKIDQIRDLYQKDGHLFSSSDLSKDIPTAIFIIINQIYLKGLTESSEREDRIENARMVNQGRIIDRTTTTSNPQKKVSP